MASTNLAVATQPSAMNYQQLTASPLAWGMVYWAQSDHHLVPLFHPGDVLDFALLEKFKAHHSVLAVDLAIDPAAVLAMVQVWQQYKNASSEEELWPLRQQLLHKMQLLATQGKTILNLVAAAAIQFLELPPAALRQTPPDYPPPAFLHGEVFQALCQMDVQVLRRSFLLATLVTYFGLGFGLTDYYFLQDLFRASLAAHWGLSEGNSFMAVQALAAEQAQSGRGIAALQEQEAQISHPSSGEEEASDAAHSPLAKAWQSFFNYPQTSVNLLQHTSSYLRHDDVLAAVAMQQEGNLEGGMPQGLCFWELNDVEKLMAVFNHLLPFAPHRYQTGDFTTILRPLFKAPTNSTFWPAVDAGFIQRCRDVLRGDEHE